MTPGLLRGFLSQVALDLGTATTQLYVQGQGIVAEEASYVAIYERGYDAGKVAAVGNRAKELCGRTAERLTASTPIVASRIKNLERAEILVRHLLPAGGRWKQMSRPNVLAMVPVDATAIERRAFIEAAQGAGIGDLYLIPDVLAVALGAGVPMTETRGAVVLDIGAGTTAVALLTMNGIVQSRATKIAGELFDERLVDHVRRAKGVTIGRGSAERAKIQVGAARLIDESLETVLTGSTVSTGMPTTVTVTQRDVVEAVREPIREIVKLVKGLLDETPPEIATDLIDNGITLVGGSALLPDLDQVLGEALGLPVSLGEDPQRTAITGCGVVLQQFAKFKHLLVAT